MTALARWAQTILAVAVLMSFPSALAGFSLRLGVPLLGWERLFTGSVFESGLALGRAQAARQGSLCAMPEVFLRESSETIASALLFLPVPAGFLEEPLIDTASLRVSRVDEEVVTVDASEPVAGQPEQPDRSQPSSLVILSAHQDGVLLVVCGFTGPEPEMPAEQESGD